MMHRSFYYRENAREVILKESVIQKSVVKDSLLIVIGTFFFALGVDCFQVPFGIAAGGVTGLAVVINAVGETLGVNIPIGTQTILFNFLLMIPVFRRGGVRYIYRVTVGIIASGFFLDILSAYVPVLEGYDLFIAVLWGGVISGFGLGIVFRSGGNTGGMDIIAQFFARKFKMSIGTVSMALNACVIALSIPVFSFRNALYAVVCMVITGKVIDLVIDGLHNERVCYVISSKHQEIASQVMYEMGRGCTEIQARGVWSGNDRPMLFIILDRGEVGILKMLVADIDPDAVVAVSEIHETYGQGFKHISTGVEK